MTFWLTLVEKMTRDYVSLKDRSESEKAAYQIVTDWLELLKRDDVPGAEAVALISRAESARAVRHDFSGYLADQLRAWAISSGFIPEHQPEAIEPLDFLKPGELSCATVRWKTTGAARYRRQTSCPSSFGVITLEIYPVLDDHECRLLWYVTEDQIPSEFRPAVKEAIETYQRNYIETEKVALVFDVAVIFGQYHEVDSNFFSFKVATRMALEKAFETNDLEPISSP